jgi:hypothetical protein
MWRGDRSLWRSACQVLAGWGRSMRVLLRTPDEYGSALSTWRQMQTRGPRLPSQEVLGPGVTWSGHRLHAPHGGFLKANLRTSLRLSVARCETVMVLNRFFERLRMSGSKAGIISAFLHHGLRPVARSSPVVVLVGRRHCRSPPCYSQVGCQTATPYGLGGGNSSCPRIGELPIGRRSRAKK